MRTLADYTIRHHFPHLENMCKSESISFSIGEEDDTVVDLTSNKYAGNILVFLKWIIGVDCLCRCGICSPF